MKILTRNPKENLVKIKVENPNDLWELEHVLEEGDLVSGRTLRRKMIERKDGEEKGEKRPVYLTLEAEKIKFHETTGNLRITGQIKEGPEDVDLDSYHTIVAEPGKVLSIVKEDGWEDWQIKTLKRAYKKPPKVLVCVLDREKATIAEVSGEVDIISNIESKTSGKQYKSEGESQYIGDIISVLKRKYEDFDKVVIAGPGFVKDDLFDKIREEDEKLGGMITKATTSQTGETGIQEVIKRGVIEKIVRDSRLAQESAEVEKLFEELSKDTGKVAYGEGNVRKAVDMGAVEKILVSERSIKEMRDLLKDAEEKGADAMIVSERHEAGEKLKNMGGVAAFLRYRIE